MDASNLSGWVGEIDLSGWPYPEARISVVARGLSGKEEVLSDRSYRLRAHECVGSFDMPAEILGSVLTVRGQALIDGRCPATVDIEVDGDSVGRARLRLPTFTSGAVHSSALFAGFEHAIVLDARRSATTHTIGAVVSGMKGGDFRIGERKVKVVHRGVTQAETKEAALLRARTLTVLDRLAQPEPPLSHDGRYRVLVFTHQLDLGGGQLYLQELLRQLAPVLESCTVVSPSDGELRRELQLLGIDVIITGMAPPMDMATYEGQVREHSMLILDSACQVVLVNTLGDFGAVDAAARLGVPSVWAIHESFEVDHWLEMRFGRGGPHPYVGDRVKSSLGAATRLVFESRATSDMFAGLATSERRRVVPYGVDTDGITNYVSGFDKAARRSHHAVAADSTVLLCVGTVEERKSQACLVEAFAEVAGDYPGATLALVGDRPGAYSTALHGLIAGLGLGERVRLLPATRDIWEWYALSDVLVSASDVESLPRSMLEAMAFGVPVLSAAVYGVPELIHDTENGWLFEPRDMRALVAALRRVLDLDPEARRTMGLCAQTRVRERHRSTNYGESYSDLFRELTAGRSAMPDEVGHSAMADEAPSSSARDAAFARACEAVRPHTTTSGRLVSAAWPDEGKHPLDEISDELRKFIAAAPRAREPHLSFLRRAASELAPQESILDVGSGMAPYRELFNHARYVTCDWEHSIYAPPTPPDILASAERIPVEDASFDAILCTQVLEHLAEPWSVLEEFHRVIRPGGKIWITAPLVWYLHEQPYDYYRFTPQGLRHLLERARFSAIEILPLTDAFTTLAQLVGDLGYLMGEAQDGFDEQRGLVAKMMQHLADLIGSLSGFDTQWILPIDYCAKATRPLSEDDG